MTRTDTVGWRTHVETYLRGQAGYEPFALPGLPVDEPPPRRHTFLAHLPTELGRAQQAAAIRERIDAGWATGAFLYEDEHTPLAWSDGWQAIADEFPEGVDLVVSPKNVEDLAKLTEWCRNWPAEIAARMVVAHWQEPEDDFTTPEARKAFCATVATVASIVRPFGIRNGVHLQSYALSAYPDYPHGPDVVAEFIDTASVDHVGWSMFEFNGHDSGAVQTYRVSDFMERYPGLDWSFDAVGFSVGIGAGEDSRNNRAVNVATAYAAICGTASSGVAWYDVLNVAKGRDYLVDVPLAPVLATTADALKGN